VRDPYAVEAARMVLGRGRVAIPSSYSTPVSSLSRNSIWQKIKPLTPTHTIYGEITYDETMKNYNIFMTEVEFYSMIGILLM
jgi:hypothetical protein